jgi:hypothetical protein
MQIPKEKRYNPYGIGIPSKEKMHEMIEHADRKVIGVKGERL